MSYQAHAPNPFLLIYKLKMKLLCLIVFSLGASLTVSASDADEMKVKRKEVYEFTEKPNVTREGDIITITFTSKDYCDATVAIEDANGRIIRHIVSGVLGNNAPPPFQKGSLKQTIIWDGKTDQGVLTDNKDELLVRVSLGLKPQFEKNLYYSPYKRISQAAPTIIACEEGVAVFEGFGVDFVKLFDRKGNYLRTIYPFPADKLKSIKSLDWRDFPQGLHLPWKQGVYQQTLLTSGDNGDWDNPNGRLGKAFSGAAINGKRIALAFEKLNRITTEGTSDHLEGGKTSYGIPQPGTKRLLEIGPSSLAISPDNKWVYLSGYSFRRHHNYNTMNGVMRIPFDEPGDATLFIGAMGLDKAQAAGLGKKPGEFDGAGSVDCDSQGRVYVSDFMNDRIQIFSPEAKFLKEIKTPKPALVRVNRKTGEIYVFSWVIPSRSLIASPTKFDSTFARFASFDDPKEISRIKLPLPRYEGQFGGTFASLSYGPFFTAEIDIWAEKPTIWIGRDCRNDIEMGVTVGNGGKAVPWEDAGVKVYQEENGKLNLIKDFGAETLKDVIRAKPPTNAVQHLYVNPKIGKIYLAEADSAPTVKASTQWIEIDPETGSEKIIELPFNAVDAAFDIDGYAYLRNTDKIMRFDSTTWKEVPFDYGGEFKSVGQDGGMGGRSTPAISAIALPSKSPVCYHQGGINVSPKGHIIASCAYRFEGISGGGNFTMEEIAAQGKGYSPSIFPGRISNSISPCIHVWDKYGALLYEDAVPGVTQVDGVAMDVNDNIYFMHKPSRNIDGKPNMNTLSETLTKVKPGKSKFLSTLEKNTPVVLPDAQKPSMPQQLRRMWGLGVEWFYPGVGYAGFNADHVGGGCACWFPRFALDYFARSFAPEPQQFAVGVVDSAGNLIMRIGQYGNVDSAGPKSKVPLGGDEVGLLHILYTGVHTDHRLFIADHGNGRLLSVKLGYHATEKIALKDTPDKK